MIRSMGDALVQSAGFFKLIVPSNTCVATPLKIQMGQSEKRQLIWSKHGIILFATCNTVGRTQNEFFADQRATAQPFDVSDHTTRSTKSNNGHMRDLCRMRFGTTDDQRCFDQTACRCPIRYGPFGMPKRTALVHIHKSRVVVAHCVRREGYSKLGHQMGESILTVICRSCRNRSVRCNEQDD